MTDTTNEQFIPQSTAQYLIVNDGPIKAAGKYVSSHLTFLAADRGCEVIAVTGPDQFGNREYLMCRRRGVGSP